MNAVLDAANKVPMMFRAQVDGRCQLQRLKDRRYSYEPQDSQRWTEEWTRESYPRSPDFGEVVQARTYELSWRFVTNGGQDDGIIRPVIGAKGWPFYPGSSMKGLFRHACATEADATAYCGDDTELSPGRLRFHGAYPTDERWKKGLLDIIHPQQKRQVQQEGRTAAFAQISLYKPELKFGISSTDPNEDWDKVWAIWERAIGAGIGCRVSSGYGQVCQPQGNLLRAFQLKGQGQAAMLIDQTSEFRPNIFRAAVRGHALRIFGGLTDAKTAEKIVGELFGSIGRDGAQVGLLTTAFENHKLDLGRINPDSRWEQSTYAVEGKLRWFVTKQLSDKEMPLLRKLIHKLTQFAMVLGGFGKSWRRADHRLFYPEYYDPGNKPLIGCHWQWQWQTGKQLNLYNPVKQIEQVPGFLNDVQAAAKAWMKHCKKPLKAPAKTARWREAWRPGNVEVWGRVADGPDDSAAIHWLHGPYVRASANPRRAAQTIKETSVTGQLGKIGRLWHRMYPEIKVLQNKTDPTDMIARPTRKYFELLTIFPDNSEEMELFLGFLDQHPFGFQKLWG